MDTFKDRVLSLWPDLTVSKIAEKIGISHMGLSRIFSNGHIPKADTLLSIHNETGCDLKWLMTGKGVPFPDSDTSKSATKAADGHNGVSYDVLGRQVDTSRFVFIPFYQDVHASAGYGIDNGDESYDYCLAFCKDFISQHISTSVQSLSVITVKGNSMEGLLNNGDLILVNHARIDPADGLYVFKIGSDLFVKLIQRLPNKKLLVKSTSPKYEPFEIDLNNEDADIAIIGRVEWLGRSML